MSSIRQEKRGRGCFTQSCSSAATEKGGEQAADCLSASLYFAEDPEEADLVFVFIGSSMTGRRCHMYGPFKGDLTSDYFLLLLLTLSTILLALMLDSINIDDWLAELSAQLDQNLDYMKKILFLNTQDFSQNHTLIEPNM